MALPNRPLTEDEARKFIADWRKSLYGAPIATFYDMLQEALQNPTPHAVRYSADVGITYTPPTKFYIGCRKHLHLPSDCEWHVPGTEKEGF